MENRDIDRLFTEKLKNLEVTPPKSVWNNIESDLKKRKRRVLPMWWFSGGIAAVLVLGFLLFSFPNDSVNKNNDAPIIIATPEMNIPDLRPTKTKDPFNKKQPEIIVTKTIKTSKEKKKLRKEKTKETLFLIANKPQQNVLNKAKKEIVKGIDENKYAINANEKENIDAIKPKIETAKKDVLIKAEVPSNLTENQALTNKNKTKKKYIKKDILVVLNDDSNKEEKKNTKKLWKISPVVAVLNSNSFSNSSPINKNLGNSTRGNNSYSYGIQVGYQLNNKWTIQSGVHLQEMQFSNSQITINKTSSSSSTIALNSGDTYSLEDSSLGSFSLNTVKQNANLSQVYGYIEIPVEIKYNVLENRKFKTELVAGFSSLFLNKNAIDLKANNFTKSGKANNLNNINFSGNVGVNFNYKFDKKWSLNLNPMFKSQFNTFNKNENGFKPYFIGVYTGINYRF
ncbi:hypothetical protein [Tenacibaculum ovolyticum]|uniref:hypothetical protein n=1 Tax=Tenacibaculum ovolyticum TaxID=104270 RepID=UPI0007ECE50C|nr:hypothetical protein [Tenacibaculum ovolyticum]